jgi:hypothetical protein
MQRMDGTTRLLIVGAVAALVAYIGSHEMGGTDRPMRGNGNHAGFKPSFDSFGSRRRPLGMHLDPTEVSPIEDRRGERSGGDLSRQLGPPPGWDDPSGPLWEEAQGGDKGPATSGAGGPWHDRRGRPYRRWRDCMLGPHGGIQCGAWQTGPAPGEE